MTSAHDHPQPPTPVKCRTCNRPMNTPLLCDACRTLYPAASHNHFELFGLEPQFDIDPDTVRRKYLELAREAHPDQHRTDPQLSAQVTARLNEAHRVLSDPVSRAEYLLELHGGKSAVEDKRVAPEVLEQTLELREQISAARAADDRPALESCVARIRANREQALQAAAGLARALPGTDDDRDALRATLNATRYYDKLLAEAQSS